MASIKAVLWSRKNKDEMYPIKIRITVNRKAKYLNCDFAVKKGQWNSRARSVRINHLDYKLINERIAFQIRKIQEAILELEKQGEFVDAESILEQIGGGRSQNFFEFSQVRLDQMYYSGRFGNLKKTKSVVKKLKDYHGSDQLMFNQINPNFLSKYEGYLRGIGNKGTTIVSNMRTIKAIVNAAIKENLLPFEKNPFHKYKIKTERTHKVKLSLEEIQALKNVKLEQGTLLWHVRNYWMFSFYCGGLRVADLMTITWRNIANGRLIYTMNKTATPKSVKILPQALEILSSYKNGEIDSNDFIFPILEKGLDYSDPSVFIPCKEGRTAVINKYLKKLTKLAAVNKNVTTHTARHSSADFLRRQGVSIYDISKILGHSNLKITEAYLASLDQESMDGSMEVLGRI